MQLFDFHADTPHKMYRNNLSFTSPALHINQATLSHFSRVWQVFAFWSDKANTDEEAWAHLWPSYQCFCSTTFPSHLTPILSVEDARLLCGRLERLDELKGAGFRMIGLFWSGDTSLGSAHDSLLDRGLTSFGVDVVKWCFENDVYVDVAHASHHSTKQILDLAEKANCPVMCSHSAFDAVWHHSRNITDDEAKRIAMLGGVIGLDFVPSHIGGDSISDLIKHITHSQHLHVFSSLCLGSDFDGTDQLPAPIQSQGDLPFFYTAMRLHGSSQEEIDGLFYLHAKQKLKSFSFPV